jgi:hypothetical protein
MPTRLPTMIQNTVINANTVTSGTDAFCQSPGLFDSQNIQNAKAGMIVKK